MKIEALEFEAGAYAGRYDCILIDPPWRYDLRVRDATHRNRIPYQSMTEAELAALPIESLAKPKGCVLWLWYTNNHSPEAMRLITAWGFTLKTIVTWVKVTKSQTITPHLGTGHYLRNVTEHLAVATIGKPQSFSHARTLTNQSTVLFARRREHSRKPEESYRLIETLQPQATRLELFARQRRHGWEVWGNEVDKFVQKDELNQENQLVLC